MVQEVMDEHSLPNTLLATPHWSHANVPAPGFVTLAHSAPMWLLITNGSPGCTLAHDDGDACNERRWQRDTSGYATASWRTRGKRRGGVSGQEAVGC
jgi:hypothetical protein